LQEVILAASQHRGTAFIEILQNCPIFNDNAFESVREKEQRNDNALFLQHDKPLRYGQELDKGLVLDTSGSLNEVTSDLAAVHNISNPSPLPAMALANLKHPVVLGVFRAVERPCYEQEVIARQKVADKNTLQTLLQGKDSWQVE